VTETMLVQGLQDDEKSMVKVAEFIHRLQPKVAYLSIPTRPPWNGWCAVRMKRRSIGSIRPSQAGLNALNT